MAEIPTFQRSVGVPSQIGGQRVSPGETGAGRAAAALGQAAQSTNELAGVLDQIQATKESAWITRATGEAEIAAAEMRTRFEQESTEGAPDFAKNLRAEFAKYREGVGKAAPSQRARGAVNERLFNVEIDLALKGGAFQAKAEIEKRATDFETGLAGTEFAVRNSPERLRELLVRTEDDLNVAGATWLPGVNIPAFQASAMANLVSSAAQGMIERKDFVGARLYVQGDEFGSMLPAETRSDLLQKIEQGEVDQFIGIESVSIAGEMNGASANSGDFGTLAQAVIHQESRGNAKAVSPKGARGLMQLMPATAEEMARRLGVEYSPELLDDPAYNKALGEEYLKIQLVKYEGNTALALAAYNAGPGRVDEWIERIGDPRTGEISTADFVDSIPFAETKDYVLKIAEFTGAGFKSPDEIMSDRLRGIGDPAIRARVAKETAAEFALGDAARERVAASEKMKIEEAAAILEVGVNRNEVSYQDINDAYASGTISSAKWVQLTKTKDDVIEATGKETEKLRSAQSRLSSGGNWNVYTKDDRDAVDLLYENSAQTPEAAIAITAKTGIAPESVVSGIRLGIAQGDKDSFELASNLLAISSTALDRNGGDEVVDRVTEFEAYSRIGYTDAARRASRSKEERDTLAVEDPVITKELSNIDKSDILAALAVDYSFFDLDINDSRVPRLKKDFQTAYREARRDGVAKGDAKAVASARMDRIWGLSSVSGAEEVMRFPPENYYPAAVDGHGYIREQVMVDIESVSGPNASDIRMTSDGITEGDIRAGQPPRYRVFYVDGTGFQQQLPGYFRADAAGAVAELTQERKKGFDKKALRAEELRGKRAEILEKARLSRIRLGFPETFGEAAN